MGRTETFARGSPRTEPLNSPIAVHGTKRSPSNWLHAPTRHHLASKAGPPPWVHPPSFRGLERSHPY